MTKINEALQATIEGNLVFQTNNDFMGTGPDSTLEGDVLCLFGGCSVPVLLRRERSYYRFVGPCAVYGLMFDKLKT
jgi:hypothetical protein